MIDITQKNCKWLTKNNNYKNSLLNTLTLPSLQRVNEIPLL